MRTDPKNQSKDFYDFGRWGYYTSSNRNGPLSGFLSEVPNLSKLCGEYKIIFAAALRYNDNTENADILLRRSVEGCKLSIQKTLFNINVGVGPRNENKVVTDRAIISGDVYMNDNSRVDRYFGGGYHFWGFKADSIAHKSYPYKASNSATIVTKRNDNKGRLYVVSEKKAFRRIENEQGPMLDGPIHESQEHETEEAERICESRHLSFICNHLGLPYEVTCRITRFIVDPPPFIFAEPGDIWIDIRLSTPVRTYILARRSEKAEKEKTLGSGSTKKSWPISNPYYRRHNRS